MVNVWAYRFGSFVSGGGWQHVIYFDTLKTLADGLKRENIGKGQVRKLGILAHGDAGGLVQLEAKRDLTPESAQGFSQDFALIRPYLSTHARLIFFSCISATGSRGTRLLNLLSGKFFPQTQIIGFEKYGIIGRNVSNTAGKVWCNTSRFFTKYCDPPSSRTTPRGQKGAPENILNEYSIYAKWSYGGQIIKKPHSEVQVKIALGPPKVVCGRRAVERAVDDPQERGNIDYIAMEQLQSLNDLWNHVQRKGFAPGAGAGKLRLLKSAELKKLSGKSRHGGVVAVYKQKFVRKFKCAAPNCPSHSQRWHFCKDFAKKFPNGPLS